VGASLLAISRPRPTIALKIQIHIFKVLNSLKK